MKFLGISFAGFLSGVVISLLGLISQDSPKHSPAGEGRIITQRVARPARNDHSLSGVPAISDEATQNLHRKIDLLEQGQKFLQQVPDYTTTLTKQEVVKGELLDPQTIVIKCRPQPFSVYLLWLEGDVGREVIYVEGKNEGKMIAHDGGWKARIPAFSLAVDCALAMRDSRYPVTRAGVSGLTEMMLDIHRQDLNDANYASCEFDEDQTIEGRMCYLVTTKYQSKETSPTYRKSVTWIDKEWKIPLQSRHYEWPPTELTNSTDHAQDEATLLEAYSFAKLNFRPRLKDRDFDRENDEYGFR